MAGQRGASRGWSAAELVATVLLILLLVAVFAPAISRVRPDPWEDAKPLLVAAWLVVAEGVVLARVVGRRRPGG